MSSNLENNDKEMQVLFLSNYEALRAAFPTIEIECYIQKPS